MEHANDQDMVLLDPIDDQMRSMAMDADRRIDYRALGGNTREVGYKLEAGSEAGVVFLGLRNAKWVMPQR